jgi:hypothetical protein
MREALYSAGDCWARGKYGKLEERKKNLATGHGTFILTIHLERP